MRTNELLCYHMDKSYKLNAEQRRQTQISMHCMILFKQGSKVGKTYWLQYNS